MEGRKYRGKKFLVISIVMAALILSVTTVFAETDVSSMVKVTYSNAVYDRVKKTTSYDVTLTNISQQVLLTPIKVVIDGISSAVVTVANADGVTEDGKPYFDYRGQISDGALCQNEVSLSKTWTCSNPNRVRFTLNLKVMGKVAEAFATIGPGGGVVEISDTNSTLYGTKIEIPTNALSQNEIITINETNLSSWLDEGTVDAGPFIELGPDGTQFQGQVYVTIPYEDKDNDGIIDYSDVPESQIQISSFDETARTWNDHPIIHQDFEKNTITFLTTHFSNYVTMICSVCTDPVFVFTIDGLKFETFFGVGNDIEPSYLRRAILDMDILNKKSCVVAYSGSKNFTLRWDGNAKNTEKIMADLNDTIKTYYDKAKEKNVTV